MRYPYINKTLKRIKSAEKKYIVISTKRGRMRQDVSRICYAKALDHTLIYHTAEGKYIAKGTLRDAVLNPL